MSMTSDIRKFRKYTRWQLSNGCLVSQLAKEVNENRLVWVCEDDYIELLEMTERLGIEVQRLTTALRTADRVLKPMRDKAQRESESK